MRVWLLALFLSVGCFAFGQPPDTISVTHRNYTSIEIYLSVVPQRSLALSH